MKRECPDEGGCHHDCGEGSCFRVVHGCPLSISGWDDWPAEVKAVNRPEGLRPSIESAMCEEADA